MTDNVDQSLRDAGIQWVKSLPEPPDLDALITNVIARSSVVTLRGRGRKVAAVFASAAAVAIAVGIGVVVAQHSSHRANVPIAGDTGSSVPAPVASSPVPPPGVAPFAVGPSGTRLPYAGAVPWSNAIESMGDAQAITVMANWSALRAAVNLCSPPVELATVAFDGDYTSIFVAGYGVPLKGICAAVQLPLQPIQITIPAGGSPQRLTDPATQMHHVALNPAETPSITSLPPGFGERTIRWDERYAIITSTYTNSRGGSIWLQSGTSRDMAGQNLPDGPVVHSFAVGTSTASVRQTGGPNQFAVTWDTSASLEFVLNIGLSDTDNPISLTQIETMCRSVQ